jgi:hypothetical protein
MNGKPTYNRHPEFQERQPRTLKTSLLPPHANDVYQQHRQFSNLNDEWSRKPNLSAPFSHNKFPS